MVFYEQQSRKHLPFIVFFILLFITGIFIFEDYGISWDESACRTETGIKNYHWMTTGDYKTLAESNAKFHGPAFELILIKIEKVFQLHDMRSIYLMRHFVNFLLFEIAVIFFYLLCLKNFKSELLAFFGTAFLVLSPRIFADAFYNSKDLAFLSVMIISMYTTIIFLEKPKIKFAILHAIVSAFLIDIRIIGIIIPAFTFFIFTINFIWNKEQRKKILQPAGFYLLLLLPLIVLLWPILWRSPIENFILAFKENSKFPWTGYVLFMGKNYISTSLPWLYLPIWILISTPLLYLLFLTIGFFFFLRNIFKRISISIATWLNLYVFFVPLFSVIFLHAVVYDGWRHLYFIYPSLIFLAVFGLEKINSILLKYKSILWTAVTCYCLYILSMMIQLHPYEHIYFNSFAGKTYGDASMKYDVDYWVLSYKEGIEHVLRTDSSSVIKFCFTEFGPGYNNTELFDEKDRARVSFALNPEVSDYYISAYRYHGYPFKYKGDYEVTRDGAILLSVFNLKNKGLNSKGDQYLTKKVPKNNVRHNDNWALGKIVSLQGPDQGRTAELIDNTVNFSSNFFYGCRDEFYASDSMVSYINFSALIKTPSHEDARIIFELDSGNTSYQWLMSSIQSTYSNQWMKKEFSLLIPQIYKPTDVIKMYLWNNTNSVFYMDSAEVKIYSIPKIEFNQIVERMP